MHMESVRVGRTETKAFINSKKSHFPFELLSDFNQYVKIM